MLRILIATAIISLGISGAAYFVVHGFPALVPALNTASPQDSPAKLAEITNNIPIQNQPLVESWTSPARQSPSNLTEQFAQKMAETLMENNPAGPQTIDGQQWINVPSVEEAATNLLAEAAANFNLKNLRVVIKDSELNISQDTSKEALTAYLLDLQKIFEEDTESQLEGIISPDYIPQLINSYQKATKTLYNLAVPKSAVEIHKKIIGLIKTKQNILEKMEQYQNDPLALISAIPALGQIELELTKLLEEMANFFHGKI